MEKPVAVWPDGMETSYWNYDKLSPEVTENSDLPLLAVGPSTEFLAAFAFGAALIALFALKRFNERSFDAASFDYRVLKELAPMELRARDLMVRAYATYVGALLLVYIALTFFGQLFFDLWTPIVATAGIGIPTPTVDFESPQWPLLISFGMAGVLPLIKPLDRVEAWLRRWSHKSAGIPVRIHENTARLRSQLAASLEASRGPLAKSVDDRAPDWLMRHVADRTAIERAFDARDQLQRLSGWLAVHRSYWPGTEVRVRLRELESEALKEAQVGIEDFDELIQQSYDKAPAAIGDRKEMSPQERLLLHRKRLERHWDLITERLERDCDELAAILAIYLDRDPRHQDIVDTDLRRLAETFAASDAIQGGPEYWIGVSLLPIFLIYALAIGFGALPLLGNVDKTLVTTLVTALLLTAKVAFIFWLPVTAASAYRYFQRVRKKWTLIEPRDPTPRMMSQLLRITVIGSGVAALGLVALGAFWSALIAQDKEAFEQLFLNNDPNFLITFLALSIIAAIQVVMVILATDAKRRGATWRELVSYGAASAALIVGYYVFYMFQLLEKTCTAAVPEATLLDCARYYEVIDFLIFSSLAVFSTSIFMPTLRDGSPLKHDKGGVGAQSLPVAATVLFMAMALFGGSSAAALEDGPETVRIGFRADAEPFSFRIDHGGEVRYDGYLADLCYMIFAGDTYTVVSEGISASTRFPDLKGPEEPDAADKLDMICDPVTVRFNEDDDRAKGVFSPIVFASGISYLARGHGNRKGHVLIGYVKDTTAAAVAKKMCQRNLFRNRNNEDDVDGSAASCDETATIKDKECKLGNLEGAEGRAYWFCEGASHTEMIKWLCGDHSVGGEPSTATRVYVGDGDIIIGKLEALSGQEKESCSTGVKRGETYTYEPYALLVTASKPRLVQHVQRRVYEIFSKPEEAMGLFRANFPGKQMTRPLASLFLLNAVEEADQFRRGSPARESVDTEQVAQSPDEVSPSDQ